ncbi:MAG: MFS transporter [Pigmentiphaga sp.]|nr:MFS transporter [Pigmentiphaga sp.]
MKAPAESAAAPRASAPAAAQPAPEARVRHGGVDAATAWRVLALFALGYFISYVYRAINVGLAPALTTEMGLSAADLGMLTGIYYLAFAVVQMPAGILIDTYGPRRVNALMMIIAAAGTVVFGLAQGYVGLMAGRILIGIGVAVCLGAAFKALAGVFPLSRLPLVNGLVMAVGGLGGVVVGTPLAELLRFTDWRMVSVALAVPTLLVALGIWLGTRTSEPEAAHRPDLAAQIQGTWEILGNGRFWQAVSLPVMTCGAFYAMQTLWLAPWLRDVEGLSPERTAGMVSVLGLAMVAGNVILGGAARYVERFGLTLYRFAGLCMLLFLGVQALVLLRAPIPDVLLWAAYGLLGSGSILAYAIMAERFSHAMLGRAGTTLTLLTFLLIFGCQVGIGWMLSLWDTLPDGRYPVEAHLSAWGVVLALQVATAVWYWWPTASVKHQ